MPIEIRELHIKASINGSEGKEGQAAQANDLDKAKVKEQLVIECVEKVLQVLRDNQER